MDGGVGFLSAKNKLAEKIPMKVGSLVVADMSDPEAKQQVELTLLGEVSIAPRPEVLTPKSTLAVEAGNLPGESSD
eukprot:11520415-Alexandrium_andersonii.AAC.1